MQEAAMHRQRTSQCFTQLTQVLGLEQSEVSHFCLVIQYECSDCIMHVGASTVQIQAAMMCSLAQPVSTCLDMCPAQVRSLPFKLQQCNLPLSVQASKVPGGV